MGALRRIWGRPRRQRGAAVAVLALAVGAGAVACDPAGLNSASVAYTTDQTVTKELERQKADVRWLTCQASYGTRSTPTATENAIAEVHCTGETTDGKDIKVDGKITRVVNGQCVRGELTAKVDGKTWFQVNGLGNCNATPEPVNNQPQGGTVTVTVTETIWCDKYPDCRPVQGK
ncbi:hypothetical protein ACIPSE_01025 [Streptomyces sp. NPDC090106]|uniref:hypothetical protein n=1 Tax=Streptomyces sp. NPDC090106 TaxID=3365946 RepID=UPI003808C4AF